jgi:hypothetical protein
VQVGLLVYGCEQASPLEKPPDPPRTREQAAALSEKQIDEPHEPPVHCHSKQECSARTDDTVAWNAEPT